MRLVMLGQVMLKLVIFNYLTLSLQSRVYLPNKLHIYINNTHILYIYIYKCKC